MSMRSGMCSSTYQWSVSRSSCGATSSHNSSAPVPINTPMPFPLTERCEQKSLHRNAGLFDDFGPVSEILADAQRELLRRDQFDLGTERAEGLLERGVCDRI